MNTYPDDTIELYLKTKDVSKRRKILTGLLCSLPVDAKAFFFDAFKKERCLDMKLYAIRGYAAYATEEEVSPLMNKLLDMLKTRAEKAPYN